MEPLSAGALATRLLGMTTATATAMLDKRGYTRQFMVGALPIQTGKRVCGRAVTVRMGPARPDLLHYHGGSTPNALWQAVEAVQPGDFLVVDCGGDVSASTTGDMLAARIQYLGGVAIVVDGALRDAAQIRELVGLPCWALGVHGSGFATTLAPLDWNIPVRCFKVTVRPGDFILADDDGLVAIPPPLAEEVANEGNEQELLERFLRPLIQRGVPTSEAYPPSEDVLQQYAAWKVTQTDVR